MSLRDETTATLKAGNWNYDLSHDEFCVELGGGITWIPYHEWDDGIDQIDGRLVGLDGAEIPGGLDIWSVGGDEFQPEGSRRYHGFFQSYSRWAEGEVYVGDPKIYGAVALVVPFQHLTEERIREALRRFRP
jgi:hypothetical protein